MTLNKHFTYDFEERPKPKLWLCKPNKQRIERLASFSKLNGTFKYTNLNSLSFQVPLVEFNEVSKTEERNKAIDMIKSKYLIEYQYNGFKDYFVIDDIKKSAMDSDYITVNTESLASELNKKSANEIELLASTIEKMMTEILSVYAPLWKLGHVDNKLSEIKRELTGNNTTVNALIDQICSLFDAVAIYNSIERTIDFYHKDNVGTNRGLRVRENSYLKSFEDQFISKDIVTRLYPFGSEGLTIQSVNPAGSSYIEDFSYFLEPFKRDEHRNVIEHSAYMTDELCHALLDYQEFYDSKKDIAEDITKSYSAILSEYSQEDFKLNQLSAVLKRQKERIELLKPKSEYIDLGTKTKNFSITTEKSSYYLLMIRNDGNLTNIKFDGKSYTVKSNDWLYIKIDTADFKDATKVDEKLKYKLEFKSSNSKLRVIYTRSSKTDFDEDDTKAIDEKYNYEKYKKLVADQEKVTTTVEKRMKSLEDQKASLIRSMSAKNYFSDEVYKERELYVYESIWTEDNHTEAKDLYEDAIKQMKKQKKLNRTVTIDLVNFIQSIDHKQDWDKLNVGDKIVFSNKIFNEKLRAYITELQLNFDDNSVKVSISDVFDYKDLDTKIAEKLAQTSSTASQVNFHKEQIKSQNGKMTKMTELIKSEWDANKKRIMAGNETVDIGSQGVKVTSKEDPNEYVIMVGGVIAMTRDGGETFKTGITPEGINAEMLMGKMIVGETLTLENESGTMKFDKNGFHINANEFHITTNDGNENYFDKLKRDMNESSKQQADIVVDKFRKEITNVIEEATDVKRIINDTTDVLNGAFKDGVITKVEKKLIKDSLATLEKENKDFEDKINLALNHPYISSDDTSAINVAVLEYESMYDSLTTSIIESISDSKITSDESEHINEAIVDYRDEVKEILSLVQDVIERTKNTQLKNEVDKVYNYANATGKRFDEWKRSEFTQTSEEIAQRVSGASWENDISPALTKINNELDEHNDHIESNTAFIKVNKDKIQNSVSGTELDAKLNKISTYESEYLVSNKEQFKIPLHENNGSLFNDSYTYEVVAKNNDLDEENVATAIFVSKGSGEGFELVELENVSKYGSHPKFIIESKQPCISLFESQNDTQNISVIYTKYLGKTSSIKTAQSLIEQKSDEINLEVKRLTKETTYNNLLLNSDFSSGWEGWNEHDSNFSIPQKSEMSINTDDNLLLNSSYRDDYVGGTGQYRRIVYNLTKPLEIGKEYTIAFDMETTRGDNKGITTILPYFPAMSDVNINVKNNERNVYTFTATKPSTQILIYTGEKGTIDNENTDIIVTEATCIEGKNPKPFLSGSNKNVLKMKYTDKANWPSVMSSFLSVGKGQEVAVGEKLTMSTYIYVPSSSKGHINGFIYFEMATYENKNQTANATIGDRLEIYPEDIKYDQWVRYSYTAEIPAYTSKNGKSNYVRALLRMGAATSGQSVDENAVYYYALPQLERGSLTTDWSLSKLDVFSTEQLASKIALNPESIDIISNSLNLNTDRLTISNDVGNFLIANDEITITNKDSTNMVRLNPNGLTLKQDGIDKMLNSLDRGGLSISAYQPRMPSFRTNGVVHVYEPLSEGAMDFSYYTMVWGAYQAAKSEGSLVGVNNDAGRINRFTYFHEKRYLKIAVTVYTDRVNLYVLCEDPIAKSRFSVTGFKGSTKDKTTTAAEIIVDLGKPTYTDKYLEILINITAGSASRSSGGFRIKNMRLTDYKDE